MAGVTVRRFTVAAQRPVSAYSDGRPRAAASFWAMLMLIPTFPARLSLRRCDEFLLWPQSLLAISRVLIAAFAQPLQIVPLFFSCRTSMCGRTILLYRQSLYRLSSAIWERENTGYEEVYR